MHALGTKLKHLPLTCLGKKSPNYLVEAVFKQVDVKAMPVQIYICSNLWMSMCIR